MTQYPIAHYKKPGYPMFLNGGTLTLTESECIVSYLKKEAARFSLAEVRAEKAPSELLYDGIRLTDGKESIDLYFLKGSKTWKQISVLFSV